MATAEFNEALETLAHFSTKLNRQNASLNPCKSETQYVCRIEPTIFEPRFAVNLRAGLKKLNSLSNSRHSQNATNHFQTSQCLCDFRALDCGERFRFCVIDPKPFNWHRTSKCAFCPAFQRYFALFNFGGLPSLVSSGFWLVLCQSQWLR